MNRGRTFNYLLLGALLSGAAGMAGDPPSKNNYSKKPLSPKQKKSRAAAKSAKQSRKSNRK